MKPSSTSKDAYRVPVAREDWTLRWRSGGNTVEARIRSLSVAAVTLAVPAEGWVPVQPGAPCEQEFTDVARQQTIVVRGEVLAWEQHGEECWVQVQLNDRDVLLAALEGSDGWRHFNRRHAFRVQPRSASFQPVQANLKWAGFQGDFVVHDVSEGGLAIRIANRDAIAIPDEKPIRVTLEDPSEPSPIEFVVRKWHEQAMGSHRRVGFRIDGLRTVYLAQVEDRLARAVLHWQRRAIQARAQIETFHGGSEPTGRPD